MTRRASGTARLSIDLAEEVDQTLPRAGASMRHSMVRDLAYLNGTASGQIDRVWSGNGTATTTPSSVDLLALTSSLRDEGVYDVAVPTLHLLVVTNTGALPLLVSGDEGAEAWQVPPGGWLAWGAGAAGVETEEAEDLIVFSTASGETTYQLLIAGRSV